jgi:hypothetical protein
MGEVVWFRAGCDRILSGANLVLQGWVRRTAEPFTFPIENGTGTH